MAELVDALVLETSPFGGESSSLSKPTCLCGGMVDTADLKSAALWACRFESCQRYIYNGELGEMD